MSSKQEFLEYMSQYGLGECNAVDALGSPPQGTTVLPHLPARGPEQGPPLDRGARIIVCLPNTPVDAKRAQVINRLPNGKYSVHLVDDESVPHEWVRDLETRGLRSDDCYLLTASFAGIPMRASEREYLPTGEVNHTEELPFLARAIVDSGASGAHYCTQSELYVQGTLQLADKPKLVSPPYGKPCWLKYSGTFRMKSNCGSDKEVLLPNTYYAPQWRRTLISVSKLDDAGYYCEFGGGGLRIREGSDP